MNKIFPREVVTLAMKTIANDQRLNQLTQANLICFLNMESDEDLVEIKRGDLLIMTWHLVRAAIKVKQEHDDNNRRSKEDV